MIKVSVLDGNISEDLDIIMGTPLDDIIINDKITEKINGNFDYNFTVKLTNKKDKSAYDLLENGNIIKVLDEIGETVNTIYKNPYEFFRIINVRKTKKEIECYCIHLVQNDIKSWYLEDSRPTNVTPREFMNKVSYDSKYKNISKFFLLLTSTDLSTINTSYFINKNVYEAIYNSENSLLNRWGGEIILKKNILEHRQRRGRETTTVIESNKNLIGFEIKINTDNLTTIIYPQGFDGIKTNEPIISDLVNNYPLAYPKLIKFEDVKVKGDNSDEGYDSLEEAQEELIRLSKKEFEEKNIDKIKATYSIDFIMLDKNEEYNGLYSETAVLNIGDTITVRENTYNTNIRVRVIERQYSPFSEKRIKTVLSNEEIKYTSGSSSSGILSEIDSLKKYGNGGLGAYIDEKIKQGLQNSYAISKQDEFLVMDNRNIDQAQNVVRLNRNGLGFSTTGYEGTYEYGFTIDGKINADLISTGTLDANLVRTGIISSKNGDTIFNLENGEISSYLEDGSKIVISPKDGFYNKFGDSKNEYHHLTEVSVLNVGDFGDGNDTLCTVQLPNEFKGKNFTPQCFIQGWFIPSGANIQTLTTGIDWESVNYSQGNFKVFCRAIDSNGEFFSNINIAYIVIA